MTEASRKYIMDRRSGGGNNLTQISTTAGGLTYQDATTKGIWKINATQQIGIATANEVGLSADRFPIRVKIGVAPAAGAQLNTTTAVSYWRLCTLDLVAVPFSARPIADTRAIENLFKHFPDLDKEMWNVVRTVPVAATPRTKGAHATVTPLSNEFFPMISLLELTDVQLAAARAKLAEIITAANAANVYPYVKISPDHVIHFLPHGYTPEAKPNIDAAAIPTAELYLNMMVNFQNLRTRYTAEMLPEGTVSVAASAIAAMFRYGLFETFTSVEYYTVYVSAVEGKPGQFSVTSSHGPNGSVGPSHLIAGQILDVTKFHITASLLEIGPGFCLAAGLNHYMHNHTTGGTVATGSLLSLMVMFGLLTNTSPRSDQELVTSLFYEALHPVNKRGIANLFFRKSRVTTHGRCTDAMRFEEFITDQFMKIRLQPQPAGAHKAYVCAAGLRRIIAGGLAMFLEWSSQINDVIETCRAVLQGGAEAHMGSFYYTGRVGLTQSSSLDRYMPEIASYMHALCKNDTLTYSAHMSPDVAAKAPLAWTQLLKALKGEDFSATDPVTVKKFLASQGKVFHTFDITKEETWAEAGETNRLSLAALDSVMQ